jgi:hypothetical protein
VVASEEGDPFGVFDLEAEEVFEGLDGVVAAINKIADEDVARPEQLEHVVELPVDVAAHRHRTGYRLHIRLFQEDFLGLFAQDAKVLLV